MRVHYLNMLNKGISHVLDMSGNDIIYSRHYVACNEEFKIDRQRPKTTMTGTRHWVVVGTKKYLMGHTPARTAPTLGGSAVGDELTMIMG